jgi:hypothetical protein
LDRTTGPIAAFAHDLRALRKLAGNSSYRELARTALYAPSVLSHAASGHRLPTLQVTLAFVAACGGDRATWERRWRKVAADVGAATDMPPAGFRPVDQPPADVPAADPSPADPPAGFPPTCLLPPVPAPVETPADIAQSWSFPRVPSTFAPPAQLPMGFNTFVGRKHALTAALRVIAQTGPVRAPLMISGPIGAGKTALALRLSDEISAEFPDGQLHAELSCCPPGSQSLMYVMRGFLQALGVPAPLVPDDPAQQIGLYRSLLAQCRLFVLLENVSDERQVRPFLGRVMRSQVVVTSRARLLGLDGTQRIDLDAFDRHESMSLIGRLAGTERVQAEYEATNAIAELCADLPLAVSIIGRKIAARPEWAISHTARLLGDRDRLMDILAVGDVNVRDRFASAYRLLPPSAQQAILELAPDGAGWTTASGLAAATGVPVHAADEVLESLVDAGLLTRANKAGRYRMSTLVSAFVASARRDASHLVVPPVDGTRSERPSTHHGMPPGAAHRPHNGVVASHDVGFAFAHGGPATA